MVLFSNHFLLFETEKMHEVSFQDKEKEHLTRLQDAEEVKVSTCVFDVCAAVPSPEHISKIERAGTMARPDVVTRC